MAESESGGDRTEAATQRRLQKAREEGQVPLSREITAFGGLAAASLALVVALPSASRETAARLQDLLGHLDAFDLSDGGAGALRFAAMAVLRVVAPIVLAALAGGVASVLLQTGPLMHGGALRPDLARLNPLSGFKRSFGMASLGELGKSLLKLAVVGAAVWSVLAGAAGRLASAADWELGTLVARTMRDVTGVLFAVLGVQAAIAVLDLVWVRLQHARRLRMSREDIRQETRESDGDPRVKGRVRQIRMQRARKRMLAAVPKATVVLTNPTHYAVALAYDRTAGAAPKVVAKGVDTMAARIREAAESSRVPLVANPPLARALYRVELDTEIPAEHYQAVAEIIAYVWRLART